MRCYIARFISHALRPLPKGTLTYLTVDNPYDLLNDFVRIGTSVLVCVALLVTLTIKSLMAEGTRELFLTGCIKT
ncbi:hypothetical protein RQP46_004118 [Phenoliferia psychrophenolica]